MPQPTSVAMPAPEPTAPSEPLPPAPPHRWRFHRVGGLDQVRLETGEDLAHLDDLDPKLWVALSCPTRGLELDGHTLELLDTDRDGRVRVPEVVAAIRWCRERLLDLEALVKGGGALHLAAIDATRPQGRVLLGAARLVLQRLGKPDADAISAADVADTARLYENTLFNGDGVIPPEAARDAGTRQLVQDVIACLGSVADRSGKPGIDAKRLDAFFEEAARFDIWTRAGEQPDVAVLGPGTTAAGEAFLAVKAKVDDFFVRCRLAAQDPRAAAAMNRAEPDLLALAARDLAASRDEVALFPLARVEPARALPLVGGVNPAWAAALDAFRRQVVVPLHGEAKTALSAEEWELISARFLPWEAWRAKKAGAAVEKLGAARVRAILAEGKGAAEALLAEDRALEAEEAAVGDVVRVVHYHRDLHTLLRNFVSFADFYDPARKAIFQAGTLYLDARSCELCVRVDDPSAHAALAGLSRMYLAYCDCRRPGGETMKIAACFTQGDADYLMVGRNGVFWDRKGRDWDATIVKVVENPISIRQAFFAPYKKLLRMIEEQVARFAAAKEKAADTRLAATAETTVGTATGAKAPAPAAAAVDVGKMVGIIAALGVGAGALGTLFGGFVAGFIELAWWAKLVAVAALVMIVSGPSMLIAWLKLRQRTLGPLLDATGWAVNGRVTVNVALGTALTGIAALPAGARRSLEDPYADGAKRRRRRIAWALVLAIAVALVLARRFHYWPFR
ncbi:hypothetical protein [Anaeromyxobacter oryzae]|uniref:EF-hand domain-containing protein n=1 Tax=Anaeromyxobacter oryzae TaxID=2918170 RepID=A0ABM7WNK4_9BACT|nr:hypothetical protein [Anaeromyxobacter oryzae]BDG01045.1 hypothetical protein AMOR_00410 [Anaeromyxobacter oryzae]